MVISELVCLVFEKRQISKSIYIELSIAISTEKPISKAVMDQRLVFESGGYGPSSILRLQLLLAALRAICGGGNGSCAAAAAEHASIQ